MAAKMMKVALGLARIVNCVDVPLNIMEAFTIGPVLAGMAGVFVGKLGNTLEKRLANEVTHEIVDIAKRVADSAGKFGAKTGEEFKQFAGTLKKHKLDVPYFPEGIGFRADLKQHLKAFDGFTQKTGIKGAHNSEAFAKAVSDNGARITKTTEHSAVPGVKVVEYEIPKLDSALKPTGEFKGGFKKTVYDPKVISDTEILQLGQIAAAQGYEKAIAQGAKSYVEKVGCIDFQVFLDGGAVSNVFPIIEGIL